MNKIDFSPYFANMHGQVFTDRHAMMPWRNQKPVAQENIQKTWANLLNQTMPKNKRLLYIHIPFCATHCTFCGFYQNKYQEDKAATYAKALIEEIKMEADSPLHQSAPIHGVYFGGGTPSALAANDLYNIISTLRQHLPLTPDCEITIEGRVNGFDDNRIDACLDAGANRFSIGVQSFQSSLRKKMARLDDGKTTQQFIENLCSKDKAAVVCDLLFGLPGQTEKLWANDLEIARDIGLDGVDLYALNILPNTALGKAIANGRTQVASPAERCDFYLQGFDFMQQNGWRCLSNSHFAKDTRERNLYNLLIKQGADCLAIGSGAGGSLNGYSWMVERNLQNWHASIEQKKKPLMMMSKPGSTQYQWRHQLQAGIETARIDLTQFTSQAEIFKPLIQQWHQAGLLINDSTCLLLTPAGRYWASNMLGALQDLLLKINQPEHQIIAQCG